MPIFVIDTLDNFNLSIAYMKRLLSVILLFYSLCAMAQESTSLSYNDTFEKPKRDFFESKSFDMIHIGAPLVAIGLVFKPINDEFKNLHDSYIYEAHTHVDDYLQYSPAALMVALKAAGVDSRSSWGRMLTSDAASLVTMTLAVNGLKSATSVKRPDSSADNSFPSGHTATAFMCATMLHKEYGARSYWYSLAGYSAATATGVMRVVNDRHWISDVLVGAGIGILSTEVGYLLGDLIFGKRGINYELDEYSKPHSWRDHDKASSAGLFVGVTTPLSKRIDIGSESVEMGIGGSVGLEGIYSINQHSGIFGRVAISSSPIKLNGVTLDDELDVVVGDIGYNYSYIISNLWRASARIYATINYHNDSQISNQLHIKECVNGAWGTGVSIEYLSNRHMAMKLFCDYNMSHIPEQSTPLLYHSMIFGVTSSVMF